MKAIEVSDEMFEFLMETSKKMNTQDNRSTASPFMYVITVEEEIPCPDDCGTTKLIDDDGDEWDLGEARKEYGEEIRKYFLLDTEEEITDMGVFKYLTEVKNAREVSFRIERVPTKGMSQNVFFTEEAIKEHMARNCYHYNKPRNYVIHTWRNPEMEKIHKFLKGLNNGNE